MTDRPECLLKAELVLLLPKVLEHPKGGTKRSFLFWLRSYVRDRVTVAAVCRCRLELLVPANYTKLLQLVSHAVFYSSVFGTISQQLLLVTPILE